jgi:hypothetical protein
MGPAQLQNATPGSDGPLMLSIPDFQKFRDKTGVSIYGYMHVGISTNNTIIKGNPGAEDSGSRYQTGGGTLYTGPGALPGDANGMPTPTDVDTPTFEQLELFIERSIKGNIVIGVTPTPAPMSKKFDWGFLTDTVYGRQAHGCLMPGYDANWAMNANPANDVFNRYMTFCEPQTYFDLYLPILKGVAFRFGRQGDQLLTDEIPPNASFSPNMFYSHDYSFYRIEQILGGRVVAMIMHSHKYGFMDGEFDLSRNMLQATNSMNGSLNYGAALRYRTPKMDTWVDYTTRFGPDEVKINCTIDEGCTIPEKALWVSDQLSQQHLFSTSHQIMWENGLEIQKEWRPHWKVTAFFQLGKQFGDGAASGTSLTVNTYTVAGPGPCGGGILYSTVPYDQTTLDGGAVAPIGIPFCSQPFNPFSPSTYIYNPDSTPRGFTGAFYDSLEGLVTYEFNKKVNVSFRAEQYHNPNHFFNAAPFAEMAYPYAENLANPHAHGEDNSVPFPIWSAIGGSFNDITGGMNYKPRKNIFIRPELRYDWQSGNYGVRAFGQNNLIIDSVYNSTDGHSRVCCKNGENWTYSSQFLAGIDTTINW